MAAAAARGRRQRPYPLWVHESTGAETLPDLLINPTVFPRMKPGDLVAIFHPENKANLSEHLILPVLPQTLSSTLRGHVSVSRHIVRPFNLRLRKDVFLKPVTSQEVTLDVVEIMCHQQYVGRVDMWRLRLSLAGKCVFVDERLQGGAELQVSGR